MTSILGPSNVKTVCSVYTYAHSWEASILSLNLSAIVSVLELAVVTLEIMLYFTSFSLETFLEEFVGFVISLFRRLNQPGHAYFPVPLAILICSRVCQFKVVLPQQNLAFFITLCSQFLPLLKIICINNKRKLKGKSPSYLILLMKKRKF